MLFFFFFPSKATRRRRSAFNGALRKSGESRCSQGVDGSLQFCGVVPDGETIENFEIILDTGDTSGC